MEGGWGERRGWRLGERGGGVLGGGGGRGRGGGGGGGGGRGKEGGGESEKGELEREGGGEGRGVSDASWRGMCSIFSTGLYSFLFAISRCKLASDVRICI